VGQYDSLPLFFKIEGFAMEKLAISTEPLIDPVCGMKVFPGNSAFVVNYQGDSYYFCAEGCRKAFESNPTNYLASKPSKPTGWWGRFLERMAKSNEEVFGCKGPKCH